MYDPDKRQKEREARMKAEISEKWNSFRKSGKAQRKRMLDHSFRFCIDDIGTGWEYIHFELDGKTVDSFRVSYIGATVRDFVSCVTEMKERDFKEIVFMSEPGEYSLLFSRRKELVYIRLPHMEDGFFLRYDVFVESITEEYRKYYSD